MTSHMKGGRKMPETSIVVFSQPQHVAAFSLVGATIVVDESDPVGIHIAAQNVAKDFGSNKRGAIFGAYTLSEQIGVSPWYFWADVPPKFHKHIFALPQTTYHGEPSVRFRGIFINDEAPALTGWARQTFGGYNSEFYKTVFELLLRLKANFLWPAMWPGYPNPGASFFADDSENAELANDYGIAVSTSHHEPMQRATNEWFAENPDGSWNWLTNKDKITKFFEEGVKRAEGLESYFTLGMRGEYDKGMKTDDPAAVVREVIKTQRAIIKEVHGREDVVPQLLALYKEVQDQYEEGNLDVPDDVTLLFADDNFGSIRRLPTGKEKDRKAGAGVYYHFEYVGTPRSYKWINSNSLGKTWHQLRQAHERNAKQIWVFNVGDIKPMEVPLTFAMQLAWDIDSIKADGFADFYEKMASATFGEERAADIGRIWHDYDRLAALRRHEHIEATTFSLLNYDEADEIASRWETLLATAEEIHKRMPTEQKAAVFETVLHPVKASCIFTKLQITLGRNQLYARQRRNTANKLARQVLGLFDADYSLSEEFHELLAGKWNYVVSQPHYGYGDTWHAPSRDMISGLCYVQRRQNSNAIVGQMGVAVEGHEGVRPGRTNEESDRTHPSRRDLLPGVTLGLMSRYGPSKRWFDVFTRGAQVIHWQASAKCSWLKLSTSGGTLDPDGDDVRVEVTIEWDQVPDDFEEEVLIDVRSREGNFEQVHLPVTGRRHPASFGRGFVEADGYVSIPAVHNPPPGYKVLPECGRTTAGAICAVHDQKTPVEPLEFKFYVFSQIRAPRLALHFKMTLDLDPAQLMSFDVQLDDRPLQTRQLLQKSDKSGDLPGGWFEAVQDCAWLRWLDMSGVDLGPGEHTVKVWLRHSNLILEQLVLDVGGLKQSYLGPPFSSYVFEDVRT
ncbi:hypothetical protein C8034_v002614 [Colletotrichum sidae]|uniref:Gylcosyl hydrolase 115 C-terminal domain-containing protein n=1 Tax=Colletotrichum sidae TaxID=1347389 RepID=A0A4R8TC07_9PEZI|nr:hypothetical protein C8034_v002614 [Colletotrichum sidae]